MYSFTVVLESKIYSVGIDSALINFDRVIDPCLNEVDIVPIGLALCSLRACVGVDIDS